MPHVGKGDIHAFLDGALGTYPEEEANHVRRHLDECSECIRSLAEERHIRQEASEVLAATAHIPVDLDPLEELIARAGEAEPSRAAGGCSRFRVLGMAATVVVSLGAGWLARDLTTDVARQPLGLDAAASLIVSEVVAEDEPVARQAVDDVVNRSETPTRSREVDALVALPATPLAAPTDPTEQNEAGRRDVVGGELRLDQQPGRESSAERAQAAAPAAQRRLEAAVSSDVPEVAGNREELAKVDPDEFADRANAVGFAELSVSARTGSFVIPGLSVSDVRLSALTDGVGPAVTVVQRLPDGGSVELLFIQSEERDVLQDARGLFDEALPTGWIQVVRAVPGGFAVIRGPLSESELTALLDRAVAAL